MEKNKNYILKFLNYTMGGYVQYMIRLSTTEENSLGFEFLERYSVLKGLHDLMIKEAKLININNFPKFPPKKFFGSTDEKFLNQRMIELDTYFNILLGSQEFSNLTTLINWIKGLTFKSINYPDGSKYEGEIKDYKKNGRGVYTLPYGCKYEGEFSDDEMSGNGVFTYADGSKFEGQFLSSQKNGKGVYTYYWGRKYEGEWRNDKRNGTGLETWPDGRKYHGTYNCDKFHGKGIYTYPDGRIFDGDFKDNIMTGKGIYTYPDGRKFDGDFKDNIMQGTGVYTWPDGRKYQGEIKNNKMNGKGVFTFPDGSLYEGEIKDDVMNGKGKIIYKNLHILEGTFKSEFGNSIIYGQGTILLNRRLEIKGGSENFEYLINLNTNNIILNLRELLNEWKKHDILINKQVDLNSALHNYRLWDLNLQESRINTIINNIASVQEQECIICFDEAKRKIILAPCGHKIMCEECYVKLPLNPSKKCPLCKKNAVTFIKAIYE